MSLEQMYQNRREQIIARAIEDVVKPYAAPADIAADGNLQVTVAENDVDTLAENGMDPALVVDVKESLGAYCWLVSLVETMISDHTGELERYKKMIVQGYELRRNLFKFGKFGCKKNKLDNQLDRLKEIIDGFGDFDMIKDLLNCHQLFKNNPGICDGLTKFNPAWIDEALQLYTDLYELRGKVKDPQGEAEISRLEREMKQAYDLYNEKVTELRGWGEFVFDGEERAENYKSEYMLRRSKLASATKRANREAEENETL